MEYRYLNHIDSPADLKKVPREDLPIVAEELRDYMVSVIAKIGGHLASSLGAVELTIALHYLFDTPQATRSFGTSATRLMATRF